MAVKTPALSFRPAALVKSVGMILGIHTDDTARLAEASPAFREDIGLSLRDVRAMGF